MKRDILKEIPGGWYGGNPGFYPETPKTGRVAIDPKKVDMAMAYLKRRKAIITEIEVRDEANGHSLMITYETR